MRYFSSLWSDLFSSRKKSRNLKTSHLIHDKKTLIFGGHKSRGFSLLEVLLAVTIAISLGSLQLGQIRRNTESVQAKAVGEQLRMVGTALNSYITLRYGQITTLSSVAAPGTVDDPGPRACDVGTGFCTITSDTLRRNGLLPNSFSGRNAYGATYQYFIRVTGAAPNWQVDGLVVTSEPYSIGANPRFDLIGEAMLTAGADSGTTRTLPTRVDGFNGSWADAGFPVNAVGLLAYRVGYGTSGFTSFMRIDGTSEMTGDLNMGTNNINDVGDIDASGDIRGARFIAQAGSDSLILDNSNDGTIIGTGAGNLVIRNTGGVAFLDRTTNTPRPVQAGDLTVGSITSDGSGSFAGGVAAASLQSTSGNIASAGDITANGGISAGGSIGTVDGDIFTTNGNISAGGVISANALNIGADSLQPNQWIISQYGGGWFMSDATWMRSRNDKSIYTGGDIRALGQVRAGNVLADNYIEITGVQTPGGACTTGRVARDSSGQIMACVNGLWDPAGGITDSNTVVGTVCTGASVCTATCATGYRLSGGGHRLEFRPTVDSSFAPQDSYGDPTNNRWIVVGGAGNDSSFRAYAICVQ